MESKQGAGAIFSCPLSTNPCSLDPKEPSLQQQLPSEQTQALGEREEVLTCVAGNPALPKQSLLGPGLPGEAPVSGQFLPTLV